MSYRAVLSSLVRELPTSGYTYSDEKQLHDGLASVLTSLGLHFEREHIAGPRDRFDFLCDSGVVIEAKVKGSLSEALRQIDRYCTRDDVNAVLLVTTRAWGLARELPRDTELHGKPVRMIRIGGQPF